MLKLRYILTGFFCLAALIPLALFWLWPTSYALHSEIKDVRERHLVIAQSLARVLEQYHNDLVTLFDVIAVNVDSPEVQYRFAPIFDSLGVRHVCITELETGKVLNSLQTGSYPCPAQVPAERWELFKSLADEDETRFTGVLPTPEGNNVLIALKIVGDRMIVGAVYTKYIAELGRGIKFGHRGHAAIVDQNGHALSHPQNEWQSNRFDMSGISAVEEMLSGKQGVASFYSPALDAEMIAGYASVAGPNWGVMVPQPISELELKARNINFAAMIILLVGLGVAILLAILASGFLTRRIDEFILLMSQVGNGNRIHKKSVPSGILTPWEFRLAYFQLFEMAHKLSQSLEVISHQANYDSLTNLPNRRSFFADLEARFHAWPDDKTQLTIGVLDLDRFKLINDLYGHVIGDKLLCLVSRRIRVRFADKLTLYRLGGDEFGIIVSEKLAQLELDALGAEICSTFDEPLCVDEVTLPVSGSIGFSSHTGTASTPLKLFEQADYALYQAKFNGRNSFTVFSDSHLADMTSSIQMLHHMHNASFFEQLHLEYQPIAHVETGRVVRVEALARWTNPRLGVVSPSNFIAAAERNGMMDKVTLHLFALAVKTMLTWPDDLSLSFNLSANDIASISTRLGIRELIHDSGLRPERFTFELTETSVIRDMKQARETVDYLRESGAQVALDDFGTGQTSLSQLHKLPIDSIKIDRSFIKGMTSNPIHMKIVSSLVQMANKLDLDCTAEGVETDQQLDDLWAMQCRYAQGFRISGPIPAHQVLPMLRKPLIPRRVRHNVA